MKQSHFFSQTQKEPPKEAEIASHKLLVQAGYVSQLGAGIYSFLPLGWKVYRKLEEIVRQEMDAIGGQEIHMPALHPKAVWESAGRWDKMDPPLFKLEDRHGKDYALASTHEEVITELARSRVSSYRDLPMAVYQIQTKFRNEMRATGGLLRLREFSMKDLYSFHTSKQDLEVYYQKVMDAYQNIFKRCELDVIPVKADAGTIGGNTCHEYTVLAESGEDTILICQECNQAVNEEVGDGKCDNCGGSFSKQKGIESGHIFQLEDVYSHKLKAHFNNEQGESKPIQMGCYGLGMDRLIATIVELHHDKNGIAWPKEVAPFRAHLLAIGESEKVSTQANEIYEQLIKRKIEVLYDDRSDTSAGEKFKDADLIGIPMRVVVSDKTIEQNKVEIKPRNEKKPKLIDPKELPNLV